MNYEFHHFGIACRSIEQETSTYKILGYENEGADFEDPIQGVRGRFLVGGGPRLELLEALDGSTVLEPWLASGARIYHQAFFVEDINRAIDELTQERAKVVVQPVKAVAFEYRQIAFLMLRNMSLIELIESA